MTIACFISSGKHPVVSDLFNSRDINGARSPRYCFTNQVGAASSWQLLFSALLINFTTSSGVTDSQLAIVCAAVSETWWSGADDVDWRTASTLSTKKDTNSSAVKPPESDDVCFSPVMSDMVLHSLLLSPLLSAISLRQYWRFFCHRITMKWTITR